jgi:CRP-like cAMP-binding protein
LLDQLSADVIARLGPDLQTVDLAAGKVLCKAGSAPSHVYFPCNGLVSMRYLTSNGDAGEIAHVGNEGMVGVTLLFGGTTTAVRAVVQAHGEALMLKADAALREFRRAGEFQATVLRYANWLLAQVTQAAICNRHHSIEKQLSRWLLGGFDRLGQDQIQVTHEALANLLGVRREGITEAAGRLQEAGCIAGRRGCIRLVDRRQLEERACECYQTICRAYARLVALPANAAGAPAR